VTVDSNVWPYDRMPEAFHVECNALDEIDSLLADKSLLGHLLPGHDLRV
jgi:hypothetical protein